MVNKITIVSRYGEHLSSAPENNRSIHGGPLYPATEVQSLLQNVQNIRFWTRRCKWDLDAMNFDAEDVAGLISSALMQGHYRGSQWCVNNETERHWAACDAYTVLKKEWLQAAKRECDVEYYIKFAIGKLGGLLLLVSAHVSD